MGASEWVKAGLYRDNCLLQGQSGTRVFAKEVFQMTEMLASRGGNVNVR